MARMDRATVQWELSMSTMQITLAILGAAIFPSMLALIGILLNRSDANSIRNEVGGLRNDLQSEMAEIRNDLQADIRILHQIAYEHHGRLKNLEKNP
jgi:hypothetical protein